MRITVIACMATVVALLGIPASASADSHVSGSEAALLHTGSVTVLFLDADMPLDVYLRTGAGVDMPPNGGAIGGAGAGIAASIVEAHRHNEFLEAMQTYAPLIEKQHIPDQEYALAQDVFGGIPWLQKAVWQRVPAGTDRRKLFTSMKNLRTQAIVLISPESMLRDDLNQVLAGYRVEIYAHDPYEDYGVKRLRNTELTSPWPEQPKDDFPPLDYRNSGSDDARAKNLAGYFADGGTRLGQEMGSARAQLKSQLIYYFTGVLPPVPATTAGAATATAAATHRP